ncbi:hypothetical protein AMTRI_Chr01g110760 [Amborella trichopoda]
MVAMILGRTLIFRPAAMSFSASPLSGFFRAFWSSSLSASATKSHGSSIISFLRPLSVAVPAINGHLVSSSGLRCFATRPTTSSLNDPSPNWSNRPPKETILLDGCDFEHWLVVMEPPEGEPTRDDIIDSYIKTLAQVVGSEEEARMKIYSVSTRHYFAFGCLVSEELSYKLKPLPKVRWVLPDSYLDVKNKDYGGEPFIDGKAVPYDPKYHEEWVRNNARANERSRRSDRPRNFDRSRNFERRRENMQNRDMPPMPNPEFQNRGSQNPMPPSDMPQRDMGPGPNMDYQNRDMPNRDFQNRNFPNRETAGMPNTGFQNRDIPNRDMGGMPPGNNQGPPGNNQGPPGNYQGPPGNHQGPPGNYQGPHQGPPGNYQGPHQGPPGNYQGPPGNYQGPPGNYQGPPGNYQGREMPVRDMPPMPNRNY